MHVILDADSIVWKASAAVEKKRWVLPITGGSTEKFPGMTKKQILKAYPEYEGKLIQEVTVEPVENALQIAKSLVLKIYNRLEELTMEPVNSYIVMLSPLDKTCFRYRVAKTIGYKSKRPPGKPKHWQAVREYLVKHWGARTCEDYYEADDAVAILATSPQYKGNIIIASIDKDLLTVPGWHYNYDTDNLRYINDFEAIDHFARQMLTGDSADTIPGLRGIGHKTANKLLEEWKLDLSSHAQHTSEAYENEILEYVERLYLERGYSISYFNEMYELLQIKTYDVVMNEDYQGN